MRFHSKFFPLTFFMINPLSNTNIRIQLFDNNQYFSTWLYYFFYFFRLSYQPQISLVLPQTNSSDNKTSHLHISSRSISFKTDRAKKKTHRLVSIRWCHTFYYIFFSFDFQMSDESQVMWWQDFVVVKNKTIH